jgi:hypothetical protein
MKQTQHDPDLRIPLSGRDIPVMHELLKVIEENYPEKVKANPGLTVIQLATIILLENKSQIDVLTKFIGGGAWTLPAIVEGNHG